MTEQQLRSELRTRADGLDASNPERLDQVHQRVRAAGRRRAAVASGGVAAMALAVVAAVALTGSGAGSADPPGPSDGRTSAPTATPAPSPTGMARLPHRSAAVTTTPEWDDSTVVTEELLAHVTNTDPGREDASRLTIEVPSELAASGVATYRYALSCVGDPDSWVIVYVDGVPGTSGSCDQSSWPTPVNSQWTAPIRTHDNRVPAESDGTEVTAVVTDRRPGFLYRGEEGTPHVPASTDAELELAVFTHDAPTIATVLGWEVTGVGERLGQVFVLDTALEAPSGADSLSLDLEPSDRQRILQVLTRYRTTRAFGVVELQLLVDGKAVDARFGRRRAAFFDERSAIIDPGGSHQVQVRVTGGDPEDVDLGLLVFEAWD